MISNRITRIRSQFAALRANTSGNAMMMMALSLPAVIGSAGLATDTAQWYMWKRELQYAVDQAALAGAYAKASNVAAVQATYSTRAALEYNSNVDIVASFDAVSGPSISLARYPTTAAADNSVLVSTTATKRLPFSSFLIDRAVTIRASAQATYIAPASYSACMYALHPTADQAFKFGGSVSGSSTCGAAARSNHATAAMKELGDNTVQLGTIVGGGGVDSTFSNNGTITANVANLSDPYASLTTPTASGASYTYPETCPAVTAASTTYKADGSTKTHNTFLYYKGNNSNNWNLQTGYVGTGYIADSWTDWVAFTNRSVTASAVLGETSESPAVPGAAVELAGRGANTYWRVPYTSTIDDFDDITPTHVPASDGKVYLQPGVYSAGITIGCDTVFAPGIYHIAGTLDFGQNKVVTGTGGVMFVMTGSSNAININSNSNITLSGISAATLTGSPYSYSTALANKWAGMLFWDPNSTAAYSMEGNAELHLSGIFYMPRRDVTFNGSSTEDGNCFMVAASTIQINGNFSLSNFCVTTGASALSIGGTTAEVKLVG